MRTRTKGIQIDDASGERIVNKEYRGHRIYKRLGKVSQDEAERWLREQQGDIDLEEADKLRRGADCLWAAGAAKYLRECKRKKLRSLDMIAWHIMLLLPFIGAMPMGEICNDALETFKLEREEDGVTNATINRSLEVVRTTVIRAARVWRHNGKPWLTTAPLIEMLDETEQKRKPYPITWQQQGELLPLLPMHLQDSVEFSLNTGARDANVCGLLWEWEMPVPELERSVFVIPGEYFKTGQPHALVLNDVAWAIVQRRRGKHPTHVFSWWNHILKKELPFAHQNNNAFQKARAAAGLKQMRVHDLRHTYGQRLRDAGVPEEDRALLLGHAVNSMPQHYAVASLERLLAAANSVRRTRDKVTVLRVVASAAARGKPEPVMVANGLVVNG